MGELMNYLSNQWLEYIISNSLEGKECNEEELEKIKELVITIVDAGADAGFSGEALDEYHVFMLKHIIKLYYIIVTGRGK